MKTTSLLLFFAMLSFWTPQKKGVTIVACLLFALAGWLEGFLEPWGLLALGGWMLLVWLMQFVHTQAPLIQGAYHATLIFITGLFFLHRVPGINNQLVIDNVQFAGDSIPFRMYYNFDKPLFAVFYLLFFGACVRTQELPRRLGVQLGTLIPLTLVVLGLAFWTHFVRYNPKLPPETFTWILGSLFLTSIGEEVFFRMYLQTYMVKWLEKLGALPMVGVLVTSVLFGVAHFAGGWTYMGLATLAGVGYGIAYRTSRKIEDAILCHFFLNAIHFFFFSYPALS